MKQRQLLSARGLVRRFSPAVVSMALRDQAVFGRARRYAAFSTGLARQNRVA
jgi:hypothetical protein